VQARFLRHKQVVSLPQKKVHFVSQFFPYRKREGRWVGGKVGWREGVGREGVGKEGGEGKPGVHDVKLLADTR